MHGRWLMLFLLASGMVLAVGVGACAGEEEEGGAGPVPSLTRAVTQAATVTTTERPAPSQSPTTTPALTPSTTAGPPSTSQPANELSPTPQSSPETTPGALTACPPFPEGRSDATVIAASILSRGSQELLIDSEEFAALSAELEHVLSLVRDADPATASIHAWDTYTPGQIVLGLESPLKEAVQNAVASQPGGAGLLTGQADFDALNAQLGGVRGVRMSHYFESEGYLTLCLDGRVNVRPASVAYSQLAGVRNATPNGLGGDGPDIDALRDGDTWYVAFRDAWGDCPAGCMGEKLMTFTVTGDEVVSVEACRAAADPNFVSLVELVGGAIPTPGPGPWGVTVGIGVYLHQNPVTGETVVLSPLVDSPAYRAGIQAGDVILAVDGQSTRGWTESDATQHISGPGCTEASLEVRHADGSVEEIAIVRDIFTVPEPIRLAHIGFELMAGTVTGVLMVAYPDANGPADQAGIRHGDLVLAVNGEPAASWTVDEAVKRLDSFEGEHLTMTVRHRDGGTEDITFSPISESCPLAIPATYMGVAYLSGDVAPAGSTITAEQGGVTWGTTTTGDAGRYEIDAPQSLRLSPPCLPDGPISFRMGDLLANELADWRPGPYELNLTFGSPPAPTPTAAAGATR